jgi:26S proteasome regulatory subunit N8
MAPLPTLVEVHPLVLLSTVDHYNRVGLDSASTKKRVVGVLLGEISRGKVDVTNSFAIPFEEDEANPHIWYLDHNFLENMLAMFKKVNAKERVVGWYSTGPKIRPADLDINELFQKFCSNPVLVIIDVRPKDLGIPTEAYITVEEVKEDGSPSTRTFAHLPSQIGALEAEEIGVEHLLRDIKDTTVSTLSSQVSAKLASLKGLQMRLREIQQYLIMVLEDKLPVNHDIIFKLQDIFNLLPNLNVEELVKSFAVKTNDMLVVVYLSSLIRGVIALHNLINNKLANKEAESAKSAAKEEKAKEKDKEKKDEAEKEDKDKKDGSKDEKS